MSWKAAMKAYEAHKQGGRMSDYLTSALETERTCFEDGCPGNGETPIADDPFTWLSGSESLFSRAATLEVYARIRRVTLSVEAGETTARDGLTRLDNEATRRMRDQIVTGSSGTHALAQSALAQAWLRTWRDPFSPDDDGLRTRWLAAFDLDTQGG